LDSKNEDFMTRVWKGVLFLLCICFFCNAARADGLDLFSHLYLSNKKYAKNIEVHTYLITKDQVAKLFSEENAEVIQKTNKELYNYSKKGIFLLIRCRNKGENAAFGILNCKIPNRGVPISIDIDTLHADNSFHDCVIHIDGGIDPNDNTLPIIIYKWKSLYTM
jgi:hypothetical protein